MKMLDCFLFLGSWGVQLQAVSPLIAGLLATTNMGRDRSTVAPSFHCTGSATRYQSQAQDLKTSPAFVSTT